MNSFFKNIFIQQSIGNRAGRKARSTYEEDELRKPRKFCDGGGVFCTIYRAIQGETGGSHQMAERREELNAPRYALYLLQHYSTRFDTNGFWII